ncbi:hypothetical protein OB955_14225 [Halobacteria archaeon AArc-m2/3/4]|uniref:Uncharacterized protein n=1 Tax=Natronoglomus mannanivorans TaxID=2979990 RepID=A0ABT2QG41_9EURY|nr:hypothetical protein [Halobacteria archaeon AArc-m2/3/4]
MGVALAVGAGYTLGMYALAALGGYQFDASSTPQLLFYVVWITGGQLLLGSLPTYLLVRYGYLSPFVLFVGIAGYAVSVELSGSADSSLAIYGMFWILPVGSILAVSGIEHVARAIVLE